MNPFKNKQDVIVHVLWEDMNESNIPQECEKIKLDIDKIKGAKDSFFTKDSKISNIVVFAEWNEDEINSKTDEIHKIPNVKKVNAHVLIPA